MASGIGDYIHLTAAGYNKYGIYRWSSRSRHKGEKYSSSGVLDTEIKRQKQLLAPISDGTIKELKELLNLFYNSKAQTTKQQDRRQAIIQEIEKHMIKTFDKRLGEINWDTGEITSTNLAEQGVKITLLQNTIEDKIGKSSKRIDPKKAEEKIKQIDNFIKNNVKLLKENNINITNVTSKLEKVKTEMERLYEDIDLTVEKELEFYDLPQIVGKNKHHTRKDEANLRDDLNEIIKMLGLAPPLNLEKGDLMEYIVAYLPFFAGRMSLDQVNKNISSMKIGGAKDPVTYSLDNFKFNGSSKLNLTKGNFSLNFNESKSQGKIDVNMTWGTDEVKASIKNYSIEDAGKTYVDTLSGSPFLFLIQDLDHNFVNHYLNLNVVHNQDQEYNAKYMKNSDKNFEKINSKDAKDSRTIMKNLLALKALSGASFNRKTVNVLIINNSKTGNVEVLKTSDILDKIQFLSASSLSVKGNGVSVSQIKNFENNPAKERDGIARINNILQQLHAIKIYASINYQAIINSKNI